MSRRRVKKQTGWLVKFAVLALSVFTAVFVLQKSLAPDCANTKSCEESLTLRVDNSETAVFGGQKITPPAIDLAQKPARKVLGEAALTGEKHIYVDLSTQTLTAKQGDTIFLQTPVSTGRWGRTPTGEFRIWTKIRSTKMSGGQGADYYYLPNVPYVMYFEGSGISAGRGFGLHGTYWHNNFGHPMSHGCVNLRTIDAEKLFYWVSPAGDEGRINATEDNPGTKITIYGETPT
ncbi:MAG TPA: L,D-transpeptidase [Patescibacteria group bacterium]|nr:L,D-transpeptidase [Patescibacteria group bacterium]